MSIGELIRQHRESKHLSRAQLAQLCSMSAEQIKNMETGRVMPKADSLQVVSDVLHLPAAKVAKALRGAS
jgi:transcriptional regulator with XRE-family HTH domain